jgi:uncharacterized membrane protein
MMRWVLGVLLILAGVNHFAKPEFYINIMPPYLPWHTELVFISGVCEVVLGAALLVPRLRRPAAWGIIALLIAVFPANLHMALQAEQFPRFSEPLLWARLPLQALLIAWAYRYTRPRQN